MEALLRAHGHMQNVLSLLQANRKSIYAMHAGAQQHQCVERLTFSLELEGAFCIEGEAFTEPFCTNGSGKAVHDLDGQGNEKVRRNPAALFDATCCVTYASA